MGSYLENHKDKVSNIDVLIAPHHGRDSGRNWDFIDVLKPRLVLIGNANSEHLNYAKYSKHGKLITNNQACDVILKVSGKEIDVYVTNEKFALKFEGNFYSEINQAYYIGYVDQEKAHLVEKDTSRSATNLIALLRGVDKQDIEFQI